MASRTLALALAGAVLAGCGSPPRPSGPSPAIVEKVATGQLPTLHSGDSVCVRITYSAQLYFGLAAATIADLRYELEGRGLKPSFSFCGEPQISGKVVFEGQASPLAVKQLLASGPSGQIPDGASSNLTASDWLGLAYLADKAAIASQTYTDNNFGVAVIDWSTASGYQGRFVAELKQGSGSMARRAFSGAIAEAITGELTNK